MDVSKAGVLPVPDTERAAGPALSGAAPEKRFAALLTESPPVAAPARPDTGRCPFTAPILEPDPPARPRPRVLEVVGERGSGRTEAPAAAPSTSREAPGWMRMADQALRAESRIDAMIDAGRRGQTFTASQLLGLQIEVFRYSQTVEVISRTTDKIIGGLKQTLGTQV